MYVTLLMASAEELKCQIINKPAVFEDFILFLFRVVVKKVDSAKLLGYNNVEQLTRK